MQFFVAKTIDIQIKFKVMQGQLSFDIIQVYNQINGQVKKVYAFWLIIFYFLKIKFNVIFSLILNYKPLFL